MYYIYYFDFLEELRLQYVIWRRWKLWKRIFLDYGLDDWKKKTIVLNSITQSTVFILAYDILTRGLHHNWKCAGLTPRV